VVVDRNSRSGESAFTQKNYPMKNSPSRQPQICVSAILFLTLTIIYSATADDFIINTNLSSLTVSGSVMGSAFTPQGTGSLTTKYRGTIQATQTASTIQFTGSSSITALTNGSWAPLPGGTNGTAPANYGGSASLVGGLVTVKAALRSMLFDVTSPAIPVTGGHFPPGSLTLVLPLAPTGTSTLDYRESGLATDFGSTLMTGNATNNVATWPA
jgi:hypothetical protein